METFQKLLAPVRPSPELMQEFHGFHTLCMACRADHFSALCQVMSSVSTHVVQKCSGQSRTKSDKDDKDVKFQISQVIYCLDIVKNERAKASVAPGPP